jgi:RES domain
MIHDQSLVDQLSVLAFERFEGEVFRATGLSADPLAFSFNGGRWAPPEGNSVDVPILYTSMERDGALAEVVSYLMLLTPLPSKPLKVSRLGVSTGKTLRFARADLEGLGIDLARYGERDYARTQSIGAALSFLGLDGLIAPSARWHCENLMIYQTNHLNGRLEVITEEEVDWQAWAHANGFSVSGPTTAPPLAPRMSDSLGSPQLRTSAAVA